ncbi:thioredoxin family protein [Robiginitalea marina]|uniref:Thioredoxin family protein n=1 Tax=Robiginitalea marina TaxID=2954105 RepID=A0ABT1AWT6_9FLAO|nr:thioredoxin family protein [Robiginitalea marina]MCO5724389.1 thioredoxin family protein [Robiginitalea marina]
MKAHLKFLLLLGWLFLAAPGHGQQDRVRWLSFEALEDSLALRPKKVFIDFYASWCVYCKKMDQVVFRDPRVVALLNADYYALRMDVETRDTIAFGGREYTNPEFGKNRNPVHEIPRLLASREGVAFTLPAMVILDTSFRVRSRYFGYLPPKKMQEILQPDTP